MTELTTITINEVEYSLRQWPALPGFKFTRVIMRTLADGYAGLTMDFSDLKAAFVGTTGTADFKVDPNMIDKVLSDKTMDEALGMIAEGLNRADGNDLEEKERKQLRQTIAKWSFPEFVFALIAVLKHNVVFLAPLVMGLFPTTKPNATSTQPAPGLPASADAQSIKS